MKSLFSFLLIALLTAGHSQNRTEDSLSLAKSIEWLERKLSITYYNMDDKEWWINDFKHNPKNHFVLIKNTSTDRLGKPGGKTYLQRSFFLSDMNPYTISIQPIETNSGRMVHGSAIRVGVYKHERKVEQTKNGMGATSMSSVYFSIPKYLEDSVKGFSKSVCDELKNAIRLATREYTGSDKPDQLKRLMNDSFKGDVEWGIELVFNNTIKIEEYQGKNLNRVLFLRLQDQKIGFTQVDAGGTSPERQMNYTTPLPGISGDGFSLVFENKNEIRLTEKGSEQTLLRHWGFDSDPQYR